MSSIITIKSHMEFISITPGILFRNVISEQNITLPLPGP